MSNSVLATTFGLQIASVKSGRRANDDDVRSVLGIHTLDKFVEGLAYPAILVGHGYERVTLVFENSLGAGGGRVDNANDSQSGLEPVLEAG